MELQAPHGPGGKELQKTAFVLSMVEISLGFSK